MNTPISTLIIISIASKFILLVAAIFAMDFQLKYRHKISVVYPNVCLYNSSNSGKLFA